MWRLLVSVAMLVLVGCYANPRGGVTPYPPGPVDVVSILLGNDYSRLCPEQYEYCRAGSRSICCPRGACCDDGAGPYCCDRGYAADDYRERGRSNEPPRDDLGPCGARSTTCARGGVTICCGEDEGCCSDDQGLYCCRGGTRGD